MMLMSHLVVSGFYGNQNIFFALLMTLPCPQKMFRVVQRCPTCVRKWKQRAEEFKCDDQFGVSFHCILASNGSLIEECLVSTPFKPGSEGCPSASIQSGSVFLDADNSLCPNNNSFCPASKHPYRSDELYLYPICFHTISERYSYNGENCEEETDVSDSVIENSTKACECINSLSCTVPWILCGLTLTASVILNISCFLLGKKTSLRDCVPCTY